jgi:hypothetical protein
MPVYTPPAKPRPYTIHLDRQLVHGSVVAGTICLGTAVVWATHDNLGTVLATLVLVAVVTRITDWMEWRAP